MEKGYIRERPAGNVWSIEVDGGRDSVTGKRRRVYKTVEGKRADAERVLRKLIVEADTGALADAGRITVGDYLVDQFLPSVRARVRPRTYEGYESLVRNHLLPGLGRIKLRDLRPVHIDQFYAKTRDAEDDGRRLSDGSMLNLHRLLSEALTDAVRLQLLVSNPARAIRMPKPRRSERITVTEEIATSLLKAARSSQVMDVVVPLALGVGLRRGEIGALRWSDVDLDAGNVSVRRSLQATREGLTFGEPKTRSSSRTVSAPAFVIAALRRGRKEQAARRLALGSAWTDLDLVVGRRYRGPVAPRPDDRGLPPPREARRSAGAPPARPAARPRDVDAGRRDPSEGRERATRPRTVALTLDMYSHVAPRLQAEAAGKLDDLLGR